MDNYSPQLCAVRVLVIKALRMIQIVLEKLLATQEEMLMSLKLLVQKLLENSTSPLRTKFNHLFFYRILIQLLSRLVIKYCADISHQGLALSFINFVTHLNKIHAFMGCSAFKKRKGNEGLLGFNEGAALLYGCVWLRCG